MCGKAEQFGELSGRIGLSDIFEWHSDRQHGCSCRCPCTMRTARSRISDEHRLGCPIGSLSRIRPSDKPGTIQ